MFVRASTLRLADLRALVPSALVAFILSRIGYLIPNRHAHPSHVRSSTQGSISYSTNHIKNGCTGSTIVIQYRASVLPHFGIEGMNSWWYHYLISTLTETQRHTIQTTIQIIWVMTALEPACVELDVSL